MRRSAVTLSCALAALTFSDSAANAAFGPCPSPHAVPTTCETLTVPLDRSGQVPGSVQLLVERRAASQPPSLGALVVLAGGPGQAATPIIDPIQRALEPALRRHDLVVFDQRGTGASDPLSCPAIDNATTFAMLDPAVEACANQLGARRAFYTSRDSADDLDAVRQALGLDKISLFGVSYGTFAALTYARRYPAHVESLVLDSVIHPDGRDPLDRSTYRAFRRMLRDVCKAGCGRITKDPVKDLTRLVHRVQARPLKVVAYSPGGKRLNGQLAEADVVRVIEGADFDPFARAELPSALVSASRGDGAPLARLLVREGSSGGTHATLGSGQATDSSALFFATACEELPFPWSRTAPLSARRGQLTTALAAVPASVYAPFSRQVEASTGTSRPCLRWPNGSPESPLVTGTPADVPVLILAGVDDTRTPLPDARLAASLFPKATLVSVPHTGHSVLGTDISTCSQEALDSFFTAGSASQCPPTAPLVSPIRIAPRSLASLRAPKGVAGKRGKTAAAVAATLSDGVLQAFARAALGAPIAGGGLRGGRLDGSLAGSALTLHFRKVVYVPGVIVSGTANVDLAFIAAPRATVRVTGPVAAKGTLNFRNGGFKGRLDGRAVQSKAKVAAAAVARKGIAAAVLRRLRASAPLREAARRP